MEVEAQTYGLDVYVRDAKDALALYQRIRLLAHELTHAQQYQRFGSSLGNFGYEYFKAYYQAGRNYERDALEAEAFALANRVARDPRLSLMV